MGFLWVAAAVGVGWFGLSILVLQDAIDRGDSRLWGFATLAFGVFGAIGYLLYRSPDTVGTYRCASCNWVFRDESAVSRHAANAGHEADLD